MVPNPAWEGLHVGVRMAPWLEEICWLTIQKADGLTQKTENAVASRFKIMF